MNVLGLKIKRWVTLVLLLTCSAFSYKVHILNPWTSDPQRTKVYIISSILPGMGPPGGVAMTDEGNGWFSYDLGTTKPAANAEFYFGSFIPTQYYEFAGAAYYYGSPSTFNMGDVFYKRSADEVWIITSGPTSVPVITDVPQAKKVAFLFNPWPDNAPMAKVGNQTAFANMHMSPDAKRCGWYGAYFMSAPFTVAFKSMFGNETYGIGGLGDAKAIDLASYFATSDTIFLVPDPIPGGPPKISTTIPTGVVGTCSFPLAVTVRDFSIQHPDFEKADMASDVATTGLVMNTLDTASKPVRSAKAYNRMSDFPNWFRDDSTNPIAANRNYTTCRDLPMSKSSGGLWGYDSYKSEASHSYFPIDDFNRFNETAASQYIDPADGTVHNDPTNGKHNFSFCMEMHATFKYKQGQEFHFVGDDDVWAFIDKKLVMDLGGPHPPLAGDVILDNLGLTAGSEYPFDFFFCERHTTGSDLTIQTSIFFEQQQSVFSKTTDVPPTGKQYDIYERTSGQHSCEATSADVVVPAKVEFKLSGPSVNPPVVLNAGTVYGGVTVNTGLTQVLIDTSKVTGLRPGVYTVTYTTAAGKGGSIQFTVSGTFALDFVSKNPVNQILGTSVPVNIEATLSGAPDKRAETFRLTPDANLLIYSDSALTQPITATTDLTTDATTGTKKVYVTSQTAGTYKLVIMGGTAKNILEDTYNNLTFFQQPKVVKPTATPPGGPFILPLSVSLQTSTVGAKIYYTMDGSDPATSGTRIEFTTTPIAISATTTLKAIAVVPGWINSDVLTETYTYTKPVAIKKAWYQDLNGDGKIETVIIDFDTDLPALPDKLEFKITDQMNQSVDLTPTASTNEIAYAAGSKSRVVVTFSQPATFGLTSVVNRDVTGSLFKQDNIPLLAASFPVDDSVPPVVFKAKVNEPDSLQRLKRIMLTTSEQVNLTLTSQSALIFKKDGQELAPGAVKINRIEKTGDHDYVIYVDSTSDMYPIVGDSIALNNNGEVRDMATNAPVKKFFMALDGIVPKAKPVDLYVTFPNSKTDVPSDGLESQGMVVFIPVNSQGTPLAGDAKDGKCAGTCYSGDNTHFVGPVFHIVTPGPVAYDFKIFTNMGEFVVAGSGKITSADLAALQKNNDASGIKYVVRVVWTGLDSKGTKAGTGAYILQTVLTTDKDAKTGAGPAKETRRTVFGMLRSFRGL